MRNILARLVLTAALLMPAKASAYNAYPEYYTESVEG
jgi:hypothetical protein